MRRVWKNVGDNEYGSWGKKSEREIGEVEIKVKGKKIDCMWDEKYIEDIRKERKNGLIKIRRSG